MFYTLKNDEFVQPKGLTLSKYYIASIPPDVIAFAGATRKNWGIENSLHWYLDVGFREDECRIRKGFAAENMAVVRHIALNMQTQVKAL